MTSGRPWISQLRISSDAQLAPLASVRLGSSLNMILPSSTATTTSHQLSNKQPEVHAKQPAMTAPVGGRPRHRLDYAPPSG